MPIVLKRSAVPLMAVEGVPVDGPNALERIYAQLRGT